MKVKNLSKMPKRKVTIDDVLNLDDFNNLITELYENRHDIDTCVFIWTTESDGLLHSNSYGIDKEDEVVGVLERVKAMLIGGESRVEKDSDNGEVTG